MRTDYDMPRKCGSCGSDNLRVGVCLDEQGRITQVRWACYECGNSDAMRKTSNTKKRMNHNQVVWAGRVKARDEYKCRICGNTIDLHAHHIIPVCVSEEHRYNVNNGITLCSKCHSLVHKEANDA